METKICENCEAVIAESETVCPKCGVTFADLDDAVVTVERANKILEKRRAKTAPPTPPAPPTPAAPPTPPAIAPVKKANIFSSLGKVIRKP